VKEQNLRISTRDKKTGHVQKQTKISRILSIVWMAWTSEVDMFRIEITT
jgi:hypothetical protein